MIDKKAIREEAYENCKSLIGCRIFVLTTSGKVKRIIDETISVVLKYYEHERKI